MTFRTTIVLGGKTATGLRVPPEVVTELGAGKRPAVRVSIGPYTYRSTVAVMREDFMIPLSAEHRAAAGLAAGDEVDVDLKLDEEPRWSRCHRTSPRSWTPRPADDSTPCPTAVSASTCWPSRMPRRQEPVNAGSRRHSTNWAAVPATKPVAIDSQGE